MKLLIISDTHLFNEHLNNITTRFKTRTDIQIHCGDSSLSQDNPLLKDYLCVKGNHDHSDFPQYIVKDNILITHGHLYNVYFGYSELINLCKINNCQFCFHGHTHIPTHQFIDGIHFINPGSTMINRGSYGFGTFAIADIINDKIEVHFYHHETFEQCDYILEESKDMLVEIKELIKASN